MAKQASHELRECLLFVPPLVVLASIEACEATVMRVGAELRILGEMKVVFNLGNEFFTAKNAAVGEECELLG